MIDRPASETLIIYGGTFDPPHQGHIDSARLAAQRFPQARVVILPAAQPAGAAGQHKQPTAEFAQRVQLCRLAFSPEHTGLGSDRLQISTLEAELPTPNYTLRTLTAVAAKNPGASLLFLIGQDQLLSFHRWHEPLAILRQASLIVVKRGVSAGYSGSLKDSVELLAQQLHEPITWGWLEKDATQQKSQAHFTRLESWLYIIDQPVCVAASSLVRGFLRKKQPLPAGWMPEMLTHYIQEQRLYA